jgi:hypothetical protein
MVIVQKPTLYMYFLKNSVLAAPVFGCVVSMDQFETICKFMIINNNDSKCPPNLFKIYPQMASLNSKFQTLYIPNQNIATCEYLTLWEGRLSFKQYSLLKSSKVGIKSYEFHESSSGCQH